MLCSDNLCFGGTVLQSQAKIRVLTEDDVDYLMSEMNAALEPAFAVLPQDHEIMLKCFEFVSRVDDLFSSGKGGMDDDSESRFELTQEAGNDGGGDDEEVIDMDALEPMESPTFQQVEHRSLEIETADPAMSDSVAALARVGCQHMHGLCLLVATHPQTNVIFSERDAFDRVHLYRHPK